ncbi:potassium channel family protein [Fictibacillus sp. Mic-4]|uniref:potassium channel family protein n=1 Tax=Fictibacillus TaxID=1329200 RepID=UPI0004279901|nr:potassium channel family protein [Fictibacillus gelatini]
MGNFFYSMLFIFSGFIVVKSLHALFQHPGIKQQMMSLNHLFVLLLVYINIILGFGLMYCSLLFMNYHVLSEKGFMLEGGLIKMMEGAMYFSAVTMLSVGYGDITPLGVGRWISITEALIGYLLPAAFVITSVIDHRKMK